MAKVTAPLFGFAASGKLANSIVYMTWKGINDVRQYVIPANPDTILQKAQRRKLTEAVAEWHAAHYNVGDVAAWRRYAGILPRIMTAFNSMVKTHVDEAVLGNTWKRLHDSYITDVTSTGFKFGIALPSADATPKIHWGVRETYMPDSADMDVSAAAKPFYTFTDLLPHTPYYVWIEVGTSGDAYGRTGIYVQRTDAG